MRADCWRDWALRTPQKSDPAAAACAARRGRIPRHAQVRRGSSKTGVLAARTANETGGSAGAIENFIKTGDCHCDFPESESASRRIALRHLQSNPRHPSFSRVRPPAESDPQHDLNRMRRAAARQFGLKSAFPTRQSGLVFDCRHGLNVVVGPGLQGIHGGFQGRKF